MTLWLLELCDEGCNLKSYYDCNTGLVVRANTALAAREIAADNACDEGPVVWLDEVQSTCEELAIAGPKGPILTANHGA